MEVGGFETIDLGHAREELLALLRERSFEQRTVVLSSGRSSDFYIDCKNVTLDAVGHVLVGRLLFTEILRFEATSTTTRFSTPGGSSSPRLILSISISSV